MNTAGITAQYGFLFQRKAFILFALENAATNQAFIFEGKDDIEISADECIYSIKAAEPSYIQVKSGLVSEVCFCKIICNWLLLDKNADDEVILFAENELQTPVTDTTKDSIFEYILNGKGKKRSSIAWKTYNKFQSLIESDPEAVLKQIESLLSIINYDICSMDDLDRRLEQVFYKNYCQDIREYELAKSKRLERLILYINQELDVAIKSKKPCTMLYSDLTRMIIKVCDEINDHRYVTKIPELKKKVRSQATQMVEDNAIREVRQLYLVDQHDEFVIDGIVHELIYKDFRDVYISQKEVDIVNLEENAYENYKNAKFSLDEHDASVPKKVYQRTVDTPIGGALLPDGPIYRKGCYIFLTGDNIDEESQITWGDSNE